MFLLPEEFNLEGSFEKMKLPPARPTSKDYGAYLDRLPSRQSQRGEYYFDGRCRHVWTMLVMLLLLISQTIIWMILYQKGKV